MNVNLNIGGLRVNTAAEGGVNAPIPVPCPRAAPRLRNFRRARRNLCRPPSTQPRATRSRRAAPSFAATSTSKAGGQDQGQAIDVTKQEEVRHDLVDGDYQIIVHVIEARDLNPVDVENGTADPVVVAKLSFPSSVVEARQNTIRKVNTLNPVFDHTMIFREKSVPVRPPAAPAAAPPPPAHRRRSAARRLIFRGRRARLSGPRSRRRPPPPPGQAEEAKLAILKLSVRDSNIASRDTVIGEFDFNISAIYKRKNHQYFHQWVALGDPSGVDKNPAGYLKVNITCLINDDEMAVSTESQVQGEKLGVKCAPAAPRASGDPPLPDPPS